ncbi:MAG: c-type cytochrome [Alphaproteobacteria bacterium]|nr:c-type cytochrome [Alphaproteobacteria bacterium]
MNEFARRYAAPMLMAGALILMALPASAGSQPIGNAEDGAKLVDQWCSQCHLTKGATVTTDTAPAFINLMNDPAYTDARLQAWLTNPHPPMPKIGLTRQMIRDVIAHLSTLRRTTPR